MLDVKIRGAGQLADLAKRMKAEGETGKGFRKELLKEIRAEGKPAVAEAKRAVQALPTDPADTRGLRRGVARGVRLRTRLTGQKVGVRISVSRFEGTNLPRLLNKGTWRHPVFGTTTYVTQTIQPGWFDETLTRFGPQVRAGVLRAMKRTADRLTRG